MLELAIYLGISYRELAESPEWYIEIASIRKAEEAEYQLQERRKAEKKSGKI